QKPRQPHLLRVPLAPRRQVLLSPAQPLQLALDDSFCLGCLRFLRRPPEMLYPSLAFHLRQEFLPKLFIPTPLGFHPLFPLPPPGRAVSGDPAFPQDTIHPQPFGPSLGLLEVIRITAPPKIPQPLLRFEQFGSHRI